MQDVLIHRIDMLSLLTAGMRLYRGHLDQEMERLFKISLVLIVAAAFMRWDSPDEPPAINQEMCESKSRAWVMAKVMVRQNLSRPEWVEFPNRRLSVTTVGRLDKSRGSRTAAAKVSEVLNRFDPDIGSFSAIGGAVPGLSSLSGVQE